MNDTTMQTRVLMANEGRSHTTTTIETLRVQTSVRAKDASDFENNASIPWLTQANPPCIVCKYNWYLVQCELYQETGMEEVTESRKQRVVTPCARNSNRQSARNLRTTLKSESTPFHQHNAGPAFRPVRRETRIGGPRRLWQPQTQRD